MNLKCIGYFDSQFAEQFMDSADVLLITAAKQYRNFLLKAGSADETGSNWFVLLEFAIPHKSSSCV